jgi:hypothetical protein
MENDAKSFGLVQFLSTVGTKELTRTNENQCTFLVVIGIFAVSDVTALNILEQDHVESEIGPPQSPRGSFGKINNTDQRVQGLMIVERIVLADRIKP